jgi:WD40 repeat protein
VLLGCIGLNRDFTEISNPLDTQILTPTKKPLFIQSPTITFNPPDPTITGKPSLTPSPTIDKTKFSIESTYFEKTQQFIDKEETKVAAFKVKCSIGQYLISFDGETLACFYSNREKKGLSLSKKQYGVVLDIHYGDIESHVDEWGERFLIPIRFSNDSKYLFFESFLGGDGFGSMCLTGNLADGLYKLEVTTGKVEAVVKRGCCLPLSFQFSPTGNLLAYMTEENVFFIEDLTSGKKQKFTSPDPLNGDFLWSPNEEKMAYGTDLDDWEKVDFARIYILTLADGTLMPILHSDNKCLILDKWDLNNKIMISAGKPSWEEDEFIIYDVSSNQHSSETITPVPK